MKSFKKSSILIALLTGSLILSGCTLSGVDSRLNGSNDNESSYHETPPTTDPNQHSFSYAKEHKIGNITVIRERGQAIPREGLTFSISEINKEFIFDYLDGVIEKGKEGQRPFINEAYTLYLADMNNDGCRDFIFTTTDGRSRRNLGALVVVYDYKNQTELFRLDDPGEFDYFVTLEDGKFVIHQNIEYLYDDPYDIENYKYVGKANLEIVDNKITANWQNFLNIDYAEISVTLADKNLTPVTLLTFDTPNTYVIENADVNNLYCINVNAVRNSGNYDDLKENLPVGYRLNGYYDIIQNKANNHQDSVCINIDGHKLKYEQVYENTNRESITVEINISGRTYNLIFENINIEYNSENNLIKYLGWDFKKSQITGHRHEYIPGGNRNPYTEEEYPFMTIATSTTLESKQYQYTTLESIVAEVNPSLVDTSCPARHYIYEVGSKEYIFDAYNKYIHYNGNFYRIIDQQSGYNTTTGTLRFRDGHESLRVDAYVPGLNSQVVENATKIYFNDKKMTDSEKVSFPDRAQYSFVIAGNTFYIVDAKTFFKGTTKYEIYSANDFSVLFPIV